MPRIEEQIDIAASTTDVFHFVHNLKSRPDWDERVVGINPLSPGRVRTGTLLSIDAGRGGQYAFSWEAEYSVYQLPKTSVLRVLDTAPSSTFKSGSETMEFSSVGDRTRVKLIWEYEARGFLKRILDGLGGRSSTQRAIRKSLANLKAMVESR
ncbi:MAG: SRPBCC family protein [Anaerolineae bacterium]|nr:SRPBCC family protein [Anaerolineae bacterium]